MDAPQLKITNSEKKNISMALRLDQQLMNGIMFYASKHNISDRSKAIRELVAKALSNEGI